MMKNLPGEQVVLLENAFKKARHRRELLRLQALLLLTQGYKRKEVAKIVHVTVHALADWVTAFNKRGIGGIVEKGQQGNNHKLTNTQKEELKTLVSAYTPEQLGLTGRFWSPVLLSTLIKDKYTFSYHQESSRRLLLLFGFSFHKPEKVNRRRSEHMKVRFEETLKKDPETGKIEKITWSW